MRLQFVVCLLSLALAGCSESPKTPGRVGPVNPPDAARNGAGDAAVDLSRIGTKALDSLTQEEARSVCVEDARRTDPCLSVALSHRDPDSCRISLDGCEANRRDGGAQFDGCSDPSYGAAGTCATTVDEYLACIDAWNATQTCDHAGFVISTPTECVPVVDGCLQFANAFHQVGRPPPCDPTESPKDTNDDIFGADGCRPVPSRFVVLGDSIAQCFAESSDVCASYLIPNFIRTIYAPDLIFETHAAVGARTADLPAQAQMVQGGSGHVVVYLWAIGNDLLAGTLDFPGWEAAWSEVFAYFTDTTRFPDGVTFLLNGQYSIYDECGTAQETGLEGTLRDVNKRLFLDVAEARPDTVAIDHYPDWLGHTGHANERGCPHCGSDNSSWLGAGPHPNALGYAHITDKWKMVLTAMYGGTCAP